MRFEKSMQTAVSALLQEFQGIRTSRATSGLLDPLRVEAYGNLVPVQQVGAVSVPDARTLVVQVWDKETVKAVEKAIRESDLGLNPVADGQTLRIPMPPLTEERRQELAKIASKYAEEAKIAIRNVRRDAIDWIKKSEKTGEVTEDEQHHLQDEAQKMTDDNIRDVDTALEKKRKDIFVV
ncbi:ribosome-recycling factor [Alphaproteobacteria bacterium]|nr:ribosome-recycling factor [Alphaproteobacteria bacterium]GHT00455.1 ribosome-recycling factor [Alphaproteobacteria bacterium]